MVSAGLLWFLFDSLRDNDLGVQLKRMPLSAITAASILLMLQGPILALRWHQVLKVLGTHIPLGKLVGISFVGLFFNQALPTSIGGDAVRMWKIAHAGVATQVAVSSVLNERLSGFIVLVLIVTVGTPFIWPMLETPNIRFLWSVVVLVSFLGLTTFLVMHRLPEPLAAQLRVTKLIQYSRNFVELLRAGRTAVSLALLGLLSWTVAIAAVVTLGLGLGISVPSGYYVILVPMVILLMIVPISIGGWGIREGAFVYLFGQVGVSSAESFVLSVFFGLALISASLPGCIFWLLERPYKTRDDRGIRFD